MKSASFTFCTVFCNNNILYEWGAGVPLFWICTICGLSLLLVFTLLQEVFRVLWFSHLLQNQQFLNSNSIRIWGTQICQSFKHLKYYHLYAKWVPDLIGLRVLFAVFLQHADDVWSVELIIFSKTQQHQPGDMLTSARTGMQAKVRLFSCQVGQF